jgi:peptidoglycan hydrolase CwlO-like protein
MDLHELATNAELNHWPPHLGVTTDTEKIAYLAERLRGAGDAETRVDELTDQVERLETANDSLEDDIVDLKAEIVDLKETIKELKAETQ